MSRKSVIRTFNCPQCGKEIRFKIKQEIDIPDDLVYKNKILQNKLFSMRCKNCGFGVPVSYDTAYNDMVQKYLLRVMPTLSKKDIQTMLAYNERLKTDRALQLARNDYRMRVVRTDMDLKEKIIIFDENLDDRIIEIMKVSCAKYIRDNMKIENDFQEFRFTKMEKSGGFRFVILFKDTKPLILNFDMEQYESIREEMGDFIEEHTVNGFNIIDARWATQTVSEYLDKYKKETEESR